MLIPSATHTARLLTTLPEEHHYKGEPNDWVKMTRPGQRMHSFLEGLVIAEDGSLFVADVPYGRIFKIAPDHSKWSVVMQYPGEPHGLAFKTNNELIVADYEKGLLTFDVDALSLSVFCDKYKVNKFKGVSDLVIDHEKNIWFTDTGRTSLSDPTGRVFKLDKAGVVTLVLENVPYPNGIAVSPDGMFVYVSATRANAVWRLLRVSPEAKVMAGVYVQLTGGLGPDGLAVSKRGELAVAHAQAGCIWLFDEYGEPITRVRTPKGMWTTSVRFGGPDERTLYIVDAQSGSIFAFDVE